MKKIAIENIKASFEANPSVEELHANEFGHCFKSPGEGLTPVKRDEVEGLVADEDAEATAGGEEGTGKKGKKK